MILSASTTFRAHNSDARTPSRAPQPPPEPGRHTREVLAKAGFDEEEIKELLASGAAFTAD